MIVNFVFVTSKSSHSHIFSLIPNEWRIEFIWLEFTRQNESYRPNLFLSTMNNDFWHLPIPPSFYPTLKKIEKTDDDTGSAIVRIKGIKLCAYTQKNRLKSFQGTRKFEWFTYTEKLFRNVVHKILVISYNPLKSS